MLPEEHLKNFFNNEKATESQDDCRNPVTPTAPFPG